MPSIQNYLLRAVFKASGRNKTIENHSVDKARNNINRLTFIAKIPKGVKFEKINCDGVSCEWAIPANLKHKGVVLYLHGGAYISGSIETHRSLVGRIARASKTKCLSVDYRLAPEHPYPAGLNDAMNVYQWLLKQGVDHKKIVIAGDSAGGGLALAATIKLKDENKPIPAATVCLSPWLDLECTGDSAWKLVEHDPMLKNGFGEIYANHYAPNQDLKHPYISPYYCNPAGLPPIFIQVSDSELVLDDSTRFVIKAKEAGVDIEMEIWERTMHVWHVFAPILPEATKAIKKLGHYIEQKIK